MSGDLVHRSMPSSVHGYLLGAWFVLSLLRLGETKASVFLAADGDLEGSVLVVLIGGGSHEDALFFLQVLLLHLQPRLLPRDLSLSKMSLDQAMITKH